MSEIASSMKTLKEIFNTRDVFRIPEFQRNFVWGEEQIDTLFNDFAEDTNEYKTKIEDLSGYLLGNIVLIGRETAKGEYEVIDGQQRLTTLTLLFCALRKRLLEELGKTDNPKYGNHALELTRYFELIDDEYEFEGVKIIHNSTLDYRQTYEDIIKSHKTSVQNKNSNSDNILTVYNAILDRLNALADENPDNLIYMRKYLESKVSLIITTAPNMEKAFQLFEVLNDRGQRLEPMDLVKNYLLKELSERQAADHQVDEFVRNWNSYIKVLSDNKLKPADFIKQFILGCEGRNIQKNKVYEYFRNDYLSEVDEKDRITYILQLANKLSSISKIYASIEKDPYSNEFLNSDNNMQMIFTLLKIKQMHPVLINFYDSNSTIKSEVVQVCLKYGASVVFSYNQTNHIEKELPAIIKALQTKQNDVDKLAVLKNKVSTLAKTYVDDLKALLPTKNLADSNIRKSTKGMQILTFIESYFCKHDIMSFSKKDFELEHIMPFEVDSINFAGYGFQDEDERCTHLNRIGNLAFLTKPDNISASNKNFDEKVDYYKTSHYIVTSTLVEEYITNVGGGAHRALHDRINQYLYMPNKLVPKYWDRIHIDDRSEKITSLLVEALKIT